MQKAIQRAIEGGWKGVDAEIIKGQIFTFGKKIVDSQALLDPEFWKCLGKTENWDELCSQCGNPKESHGYRHVYSPSDNKWEDKWHSLMDHLTDDGNVADFFNKLLK